MLTIAVIGSPFASNVMQTLREHYGGEVLGDTVAKHMVEWRGTVDDEQLAVMAVPDFADPDTVVRALGHGDAVIFVVDPSPESVCGCDAMVWCRLLVRDNALDPDGDWLAPEPGEPLIWLTEGVCGCDAMVWCRLLVRDNVLEEIRPATFTRETFRTAHIVSVGGAVTECERQLGIQRDPRLNLGTLRDLIENLN